MVRPVYPKDALRTDVKGAVLARVKVSPAGKTEEISVLEGDRSLAKKSVAAICKWRFRLVLADRHPVETVYGIRIRVNSLKAISGHPRNTISTIQLCFES